MTGQAGCLLRRRLGKTLAHHPLQDRAGRVAGDLGDDAHRPRLLEAGELAATPREDVGFGERLIFLHHELIVHVNGFSGCRKIRCPDGALLPAKPSADERAPPCSVQGDLDPRRERRQGAPPGGPG
jgi:hypothetical protein